MLAVAVVNNSLAFDGNTSAMNKLSFISQLSLLIPTWERMAPGEAP